MDVPTPEVAAVAAMAAALLLDLHGRVLREVAVALGCHHQGLAQLSRCAQFSSRTKQSLGCKSMVQALYSKSLPKVLNTESTMHN